MSTQTLINGISNCKITKIPGCVNPKNKDNKCFMYSVSIACAYKNITQQIKSCGSKNKIMTLTNKRDNLGVQYKNYIYMSNFNGISFPTQSNSKTFQTFENNNNDIGLHVYSCNLIKNENGKFVCDRANKKVIYQSKKTNVKDYIYLLFVYSDNDLEYGHFLPIVNINKFRKSEKKGGHTYYYCEKCLSSFSSVKLFNAHCKIKCDSHTKGELSHNRMVISKNVTYDTICDKISQPKSKIFTYELFVKLAKYNKIDVFIKLCENITRFRKSLDWFRRTLRTSTNAKKFNVNYIFKYSYYHKNADILISFINIFLEPALNGIADYYILLNSNISIYPIIDVIILYLKYIKSKKSSFYKICIYKIINCLPIKNIYFKNNCYDSAIFTLFDIYYKYDGNTKYNVKDNDISNICFKNLSNNLDIFKYFLYTYYKQHASGYIKTIDFEKIINISRLYHNNKTIHEIISTLFMFTLVYSIRYKYIKIFSEFSIFLLDNPDYICFDIAIILFFKYYKSNTDILFLKDKERGTINNDVYANIIFKIIENQYMINNITNDITNGIYDYELYIYYFLNNHDNDSKIYLCIKNIIIKSNVTNTIEYTYGNK